MKLSILTTRYKNNPILSPNEQNSWEKDAVFNGSVLKDNDKFHLVYRAIGLSNIGETRSTIGYAESNDGINFSNRRQLITPEKEWEKFGCEDPRLTKIDDLFFIFYTAISTNPPSPDGIKVSLALTHDLNKIEEKHLITPFNAKAMSLFPEKINGKYVGILTINTDRPPAKIGIITFDNLEQIWDQSYWHTWYENQSQYILPLKRDEFDQIEIGAAPIKTEKGWLIIYSYIKNYLSSNKLFTAEAALLDINNPLIVTSAIHEPLLAPLEYYEKFGNIPNVIFPSGTLVLDNLLYFYYGATDTTLCLATIPVNDLLNAVVENNEADIPPTLNSIDLIRFDGNPIMTPDSSHRFEEKAAFNPTAIALDGIIYIIYRSMDNKDTSTMGYALTKDGYHLIKRASFPIYTPREDFEKPTRNGGSGCEDGRLTVINDTIYMCYTAYNSITPRVAFTKIQKDDFLNEHWHWKTPMLITEPNVPNKDACLLPEKVNGKYVFFHRIEPDIWIDFVDTLEFPDNTFLGGTKLFSPRAHSWDSLKIGLSGTPIKTELGWLVIYHGVSSLDDKYRLGIMLLQLEDPTKVLLRLDEPILQPTAEYEDRGIRSGTVFSCGAVIVNDTLFVYYGGADINTCVARISFSYLLSIIKSRIPTHTYQTISIAKNQPQVKLPGNQFDIADNNNK